MANLKKLLKESIDQRKREVYLKAAIDMATAYSRRGYTQDEAVKDAAKGIENVYGYILTPEDLEAVKYHVPENPQFKEIIVKPTDPTKELKQALVDAMYEDYINNFDGEFEEWVEHCLDYIPGKVLLALDALREVVGIDETDDFFNDEAFERVRGMVEDGSLEEIIVKPTVGFSSRKHLKFTLNLSRKFSIEDAQLEMGNAFNAAKDCYNDTIDENQEMADADGMEPNFDHIELIEHAEGYYDVRVGEESAVVFIGSNYEESLEIYDAYLEFKQDPNSSKIDDLLSNNDFSMMNILYSDGERAPSGNLEEITVKPAKGIPKIITLTFDTMWLLDKIYDSAIDFGMDLKPVEDINFKALQKELQEDLETQMTQYYFEHLINGGGLEDFLQYDEDED